MNKNKEGSQVAHVAYETKDVHLMVIVVGDLIYNFE